MPTYRPSFISLTSPLASASIKERPEMSDILKIVPLERLSSILNNLPSLPSKVRAVPVPDGLTFKSMELTEDEPFNFKTGLSPPEAKIRPETKDASPTVREDYLR